MEQEHGHRFTDDVAAPDDDGVLTGDRNVVTPENLNDAVGRAGAQAGASGREQADVERMETVDIFFGRDGEQDALRIDVRRQRKLYENAIDVRRVVEVPDENQEVFSGDIGFGRDGFAADADILGRLRLVADVNLGSRVIADKHDGQARGAACLFYKALDARAAL